MRDRRAAHNRGAHRRQAVQTAPRGVDCVHGVRPNVGLTGSRLSPSDIALWDAGVKLYTLPYYASTTSLQTKGEALTGLLCASARGWQWADKNRDAAVGLPVKAHPNLDRADERVAADVLLSYSFGDGARAQGWGTMDPAVWAGQIALSPSTAPRCSTRSTWPPSPNCNASGATWSSATMPAWLC